MFSGVGLGILKCSSTTVIFLFCLFSLLLMIATVFGNLLGKIKVIKMCDYVQYYLHIIAIRRSKISTTCFWFHWRLGSGGSIFKEWYSIGWFKLKNSFSSLKIPYTVGNPIKKRAIFQVFRQKFP